MSLQLIPDDIKVRLIENGRKAAVEGKHDPWPVVRLFLPDTGAYWLLAELSPHDGDTAFGLCDLTQGAPELGSVSLRELQDMRGPTGLQVERDLSFHATQSICAYADIARSK